MKPTPRRLEYFNTHTPGLAIRVSASGKKTWALLYRTKPGEDAALQASRLRRLTLRDLPRFGSERGSTRAQIRAREDREGAGSRRYQQARRRAAARTGDTVADLAKDYITKHAKVHKRSWRDDQRMLDAEVLPAWKARKVKELGRRDVRELIEAIADRGSPITANRCLALVRKMLNYAIEKDWIEANVASLIRKPGAERSRRRVLTPDEIRLVWKACDGERPVMCALVRLRLITAQRGGELARIRWTDIDGAWLTIPSTLTKNKVTTSRAVDDARARDSLGAPSNRRVRLRLSRPNGKPAAWGREESRQPDRRSCAGSVARSGSDRGGV